MQIGKCVLITLLVFGLGMLWAIEDQRSCFRVASSSSRRIVLELDSPEPQISQEQINGESFSKISMAGAELSLENGCPELPMYCGMVAIPQNAAYSVRYEYLSERVIPALRPKPVVADNNRRAVLGEAYQRLENYPSQVVSHSEAAWLRDFRVLALQTWPLSWNPQENALRLYENIRITIEFSYPDAGASPVPYTSYSYAFKDLYEAQIINFGDYRQLGNTSQLSRILLIHGDYNDPIFTYKLDGFVRWKRQKGFAVTAVSTSEAGSTNADIKSYIQGLYDDPATRPDYIILVGDVGGSFAVPTWFETESGYNGEGDYPYTHLSGNDLLGDAFIGRISAENTAQLGTILSKIYAYEKNVNTSVPASAWLDRMLIIGDPNESGISCAYVSHFIQEIAEAAHPEYTFIENYVSGFANTINSGINQGVGFFTFRGMYGMDGWTPSSSLINGGKLPHSVVITCMTGNFAETSPSEAFIRLGTEASPAGGVTCIGMSTGGTHTGFNNALISGTMSGIFTHGMRTMGEALLNGRLYLHTLSGAVEPVYARSLAHWCNLMGDPSMEAWVGIPGTLNLQIPEVLSQGTISMEIGISDDASLPIEGACVTAYSSSLDQVLATAFTNDRGIANLIFAEPLSSDLLITASKHDFKPVQQSVTLEGNGGALYSSHLVIDNGTDGSTGNGDGNANATETLALEVELRNGSEVLLSGLNATLSTDHPQVQLLVSTSAYPDLNPASVSTGNIPFTFRLSSTIAPHERIRFVLNVTDANSQQHQSVFYVDAYNASMSVSSFSILDGGNGILDPGENASLSLQISNDSCYPATALMGELSSLNGFLVVLDSLSSFGDVMPNSQAASMSNFQIEANPALIPGMQMPMRLRIFNNNGFEQISVFNIQIGSVSQNTPLGPDEYGYLIYDQSDTAYPDCPSYEWVEIAPSLGGPGLEVPDLRDSGFGNWEGDALDAQVLKTLDLPFSFPFYGISYDQITVCTNGFIAFGTTQDGDFRNARLPGGQGPTPMLAAFWDDLLFRGESGIFTHFDDTLHRYIIQYHNAENGYDHTYKEDFQVILYDPIFYPTGLGDGMIKIQYKNFNNVDLGGGGAHPLHGKYCTIGIKDHTNLRGLEYSFNNIFPQAAAALGNETAILITTVPAHHQAANLVLGHVNVNDSDNNTHLEPGESAQIGIKLMNTGLATARNVTLSISSISAYASVQEAHSAYPDIPGGAYAVNSFPFTISIADSCPDGTRVDLQCEVRAGDELWTYPMALIIFHPQLALGRVCIYDYEANNNGILDPNESSLMIVNLKNTSRVNVSNVGCNLSCNSEHVTLIDSEKYLAVIPPYGTAQFVYRIAVSGAATPGTIIDFEVAYQGDMTALQSDQVALRIGSPTAVYNDFESSNGGYQAPANTWEWGTSQVAGAHSGTKVWGTLLNEDYPSNRTYSLTSQGMYLGTNPFLEFYQYLDMESAQDGGNLKISVNYGPWVLLTPVGGYPYSNVAALDEPGFSGSAAWSLARFDLSDYSNKNVRFRWDFASDSQNQGQGWFIDDVSTYASDKYAGMISGQVLLNEAQSRASGIWVRNLEGYSAVTDSTGAYRLFLPQGMHAIQASIPGYQSATAADLLFYPGMSPLIRDLQLLEFQPVCSFTASHTQDAVHLSWKPPLVTALPVIGYKVMQKMNVGTFEEVDTIADTLYQVLLTIPALYSFYVQTVYAGGESLPSTIYSVDFPFPDVPPIPATQLYPNYPNPFNPSTTIRFDLATAGVVQLRIFNLRGQLVRKLWHGELEADTHEYIWDGRDKNNRQVASGVYFYQLVGPGYQKTRKMLLMK